MQIVMQGVFVLNAAHEDSTIERFQKWERTENANKWARHINKRLQMTERKTWDEMRERMQEWEQKSKCFKERTNEGECQPLKRVQEWMKKGTNENQNKMTQWKNDGKKERRKIGKEKDFRGREWTSKKWIQEVQINERDDTIKRTI